MKNWLYNIGLGAVYVGIILIIAYFSLDAYTRHGNQVTVPDLMKMNPIEAEEKLAELGLNLKINDTMYLDNFKPGVIVEQLPYAKENVKENRTIYVTVNATTKPRVSMPKLVDCSLNLAKALLKNAGLVLGNVKYQYGDMGHNLVIEQRVGGSPIEAGQKILKGTKVDLTVLDDQNGGSLDTSAVTEDVIE